MHDSGDQITVENKLDSLRPLYAFIERFASRTGASETVRRNVSLIIEELFSNTVSYGYPEGASDMIVVELVKGKDHIEICLTDHAIAFDSGGHEAGPPDETPVGERAIGGLGLFLVHQLSDSVTNAREKGTNITRVTIPCE